MRGNRKCGRKVREEKMEGKESNKLQLEPMGFQPA